VPVIRLFKPSALGIVIAAAITLVLGFPTTRYVKQLGAQDASLETITTVGTPAWVEWSDTGMWKVSAFAFPSLVLIWSVPMILVTGLRRWRHWHEPLRAFRLAMFALPILSLAGGITFSLRYWGFAWSLPSLDSRLSQTKWVAIAPFQKEEVGDGWELQPRSQLETIVRDTPGETDCCQEGRIVEKLTRANRLLSLRDLTQSELGHLRDLTRKVARFEASEPGYDWQRYLRGVLLYGHLEGEGAVAFAAITGGEESNDHYPTYEVFFATEGTPRLLSQHLYFGDIAGTEGLSAGWFSLVLFVLGLVIAPTLYLLVAAVNSVREAYFSAARPTTTP
jgi:hypothetical protein